MDINWDEDKVLEAGEIAYKLYWDSGGPGAGADFEIIYKYLGKYFRAASDEPMDGPHDSLNEVLDDRYLTVTDASEAIWCTEISAEEIVKRIELCEVMDGHRLSINDISYEVDSGRLKKVKK
jgi:hypothetical protein